MDISSWNQFPTADDPMGLYKYASIHFFLDRNLRTISRETYGVLDLISAVGGLNAALLRIGG